MLKLLRFGFVGALFALPFAIPAASQAAEPVRVIRCAPCRPAPCFSYHYRFWHGHVRHWR
jgi:hypothetical protein